jgi:hypothetical protein
VLKRHLPGTIRAGLPALAAVSLALLLQLHPATVRAAGTQYDASVLPLMAVAKSLAGSPVDYRAEFARIALEEMANAYDEEVVRAQEQVANPPQKRKKRRTDPAAERKARRELANWAVSTSDYAQRLRDMSRTIGDFTDVTIVVEAHDELRLVFNGQSIIVSGPRIDKPGPLNRRIVNRFCFIYPCDTVVPQATAAGSDAEADSNSTAGYYSNVDAPPSGHWSFAQNRKPTFITPNGLRFTYDDTTDLKEKEKRSLALADDLALVARTLTALRRQGTRIDWDRLSLVPTGEGTREKIVLNAHQDSVVISLPALAQAPTIWQSSLSWLHQQVDPDAATTQPVPPDAGRVTPPAQSRDYMERIPIDR